MLIKGENIEKTLNKHGFKVEDWEFLDALVAMEGWSGGIQELDEVLAEIVTKYGSI